MVKVKLNEVSAVESKLDIESWLQQLQQTIEVKSLERIRQACQLSLRVVDDAQHQGTSWGKGANSLRIGLEMAEILAQLRLDDDSIIAAILYRAVREGNLTLRAIETAFGSTIAKLIKGVLRMVAISNLRHYSQMTALDQVPAQVNNVRKMLLALVDDVRVALIKLVERTCAIRWAKHMEPERRLRVAHEVFDIYAPLAHRLGIGQIKWQLEDLAFRYLHQQEYKYIANLLDEKRLNREQFIATTLAKIGDALKVNGIKAELYGRAKHIYSIWRKMRLKNIPFTEIYDIRAVRILVAEVRECYAALGIVHALWRHIPNEFDDYIATPKANGYRSLHTAVVGQDGRPLEVQIRTHDMHDEAELGVCAHWRYKESGSAKTRHKVGSYEEKMAWLRQVLEWQEEIGDLEGLVEQFQASAMEQRVYVFTPDGHVIDLPQGSTPVDFAYYIHTEVGHRCRGAKVNGRIVPLSYRLRTGEQVEILKATEARPSRDWLNPGLGYVTNSRVRAKVQAWFKKQNRENNINAGKVILQRELKRLALANIDLKAIAKQLNLKSNEEIYAALGAGDLKLSQLLNALQPLLEQDLAKQPSSFVQPAGKQAAKPEGGVHIEGVGNLLTHMAGCCKPVPGDAIIGYITLGRGVSIHRQDCLHVLKLAEDDKRRLITVDWQQQQAAHTYPVEIKVRAYDRRGLLRDITALLANEKINVLGINTLSDLRQTTASLSLTLEIAGLQDLGRILAKINQLPNVVQAQRATSGRRS